MMLKDLDYALRALKRSPGFAAAAVLSLALGLGANTALFSAVDAVLLRPLPYRDPDRLGLVWSVTRAYPLMNAALPDFKAYRDRSHSFEGMAAFYTSRRNVSAPGAEAERALLGRVTSGLPGVLGAQPELGRFFSEEEEAWGRHRVAVLSHRMWVQRFGGNPDVVGRTLSVDGEPWTILGVMPASFTFDDPLIDLWTPISFPADSSMLTRGNHFVGVIARRKQAVSEDAARKDLSQVAEQLAKEFPNNVGMGAALQPLREALSGPVRPALLLLLGAVGLVLLIACANVANLLLARGAARGREIAVRAALGATRARLVRQLLTESLVLALAGGALGCVLALWALSGISALGGEVLAHLPPLTLDLRVLAFTLLLSMSTGIAFGLAPALLLSQHTLADALKEGAPSLAGRSGRLRSALVVAEVALSLVLLAGAGLLLRSLQALHGVDPGFRADHLLTANLQLPGQRFPDPKARLAFAREVVSRVATLPGVASAGAGSNVPLTGSTWGKWVSAEGQPEPATLDEVGSCLFQLVTGDYFRTLGMQLVRGRFVEDPKEPAVVINESAARQLFGSADAVGQRIWLGPPERFLPDQTQPYPRYTVAGVVRDVRSMGPARKAPAEVWLRQEQSDEGGSGLYLIARFSGGAGPLTKALRDTVRALDPEQALADVKTMEQRLGESVTQARFSAFLLALFAGLALALAVLGVYAVMAYSVAQRTREMGVRMALGAAAGDVLRLVFRQGSVLVGAGLAIGLVAMVAASRLLSALLFGVSAIDPATYLSVAGIQAAVAALALYLPARRASRLHPAIALRAE
jgi:putative ABC transport system permease protein